MNKKSAAISIWMICTGALLHACGSSDNTVTNSTVDLSFSDAAVDSASEVVITVDSIVFRRNESDDDLDRSKSDDIVVDTFYQGEGLAEADTFTLDLLTVQGEDKRLVVDAVDLPVGEYSNMLIEVVDDPNQTYVIDDTGSKSLKVPSGVLKLGRFTIEPTSKQSMVVEFSLQQSMTFNPGPDRYILKPRGVRIVSVDKAALVKGNIDHASLQNSTQCILDDTGGIRGKIYLYSGHSLDKSKLADNFDPEVVDNPESMIAPVMSASLGAESYTLSYLDPGNYTLAVSCHSDVDDAEALQSLMIPTPEDQLVELSLVEGQILVCDVSGEELLCTGESTMSE